MFDIWRDLQLEHSRLTGFGIYVESAAIAVWTAALNHESGLDSMPDEPIVKALIDHIEKCFNRFRCVLTK